MEGVPSFYAETDLERILKLKELVLFQSSKIEIKKKCSKYFKNSVLCCPDIGMHFINCLLISIKLYMNNPCP
jgi:hypothetical protein